MDNAGKMSRHLSKGLILTSGTSIGVNLAWMVFRTFGRVYRITTRMLSPLIGNDDITTDINSTSQFIFNAADPYWNKLLLSGYTYEAKIFALLKCVRDQDVFFLDCGSNYGFWSVLASSKECGNKQVLAIEAGSEAYTWLMRNRALNGNRFDIIKKAVFRTRGNILHFSTENHPSARRLDASTEFYEEIETTTIDKSLEQAGNTKPVIIKLDVEGAEIAAIEGAAKNLAGDALLAYEDHGGDRESLVSKYALETLGYSVYFWTGGQAFKKAITVAEINRLKTDKQLGYNFFACRADGYFAKILDQATT